MIKYNTQFYNNNYYYCRIVYYIIIIINYSEDAPVIEIFLLPNCTSII